jgi:dethiobiotin synthetase
VTVCFVTGTDTGVGKTVVTAALAVILRARGRNAAALPPPDFRAQAADWIKLEFPAQ